MKVIVTATETITLDLDEYDLDEIIDNGDPVNTETVRALAVNIFETADALRPGVIYTVTIDHDWDTDA